MRLLLNALGAACVVLALLGVFLPLLPTTPFLLLASACFARGSVRMHNWLRTNRLFGRYLRDWEDGRGLPARGKAAILLLMWGSMAWSMTRVGPWLVGLLALIGLAVTVFLLRFVPTKR